MMHYKPLYGNPMNLGNTDADADIIVSEVGEVVNAPIIFVQNNTQEAWMNLLTALAAEGKNFIVLDPDTFDTLDMSLQSTLHDGIVVWNDGNSEAFPAILEMLETADQSIADAAPEVIITPEGGVEEEPTDSPEEIARANMVLQGLTEVYGSRDFVNTDNDLYPVLYEATVGIEEALGTSGVITSANVAEALEYFNNIAFPDYQPEELISALYFVASGNLDVLDAEEESMIVDDSRVDALCSDRNKAIVLAAFGADASAKFIQFCNAAIASRKVEWEDVAGRNLAKLLGVDNAAFEQYVVEAFDSATSEELAAEGSALLEELVGGVIRDPEDNLRQPPKTAEEPVKATSAEGANMYVAGAAVAGVAVGLTYLYRKIRESR